jgi:hypothetical protein
MFGTSKKPEKHSDIFNVLGKLAEGVVKAIRVPNEPPVNSAKSIDSGSTGISPSKRASLRTQYITQLQQLHCLYEAGALTTLQKSDTLAKLCEL